jgi:hypothetical protein
VRAARPGLFPRRSRVCSTSASSVLWAPVGSDQKEEKNMIEAGSAALNLANLVTSIAANVTYLLQAWGVL